MEARIDMCDLLVQEPPLRAVQDRGWNDAKRTDAFYEGGIPKVAGKSSKIIGKSSDKWKIMGKPWDKYTIHGGFFIKDSWKFHG
jgi:hypothetical protein